MDATNLIKEIYDKCEEALYEQDDFDFSQDGEFGGIDASISAIFNYKTCQVECSVVFNAHSKNHTEVLIYHNNDNHDLSNIEKAVNEYMCANLSLHALLDNMIDKAREASYDEWEEHGFRNAADYYNWRYGS